MLILLDTNALVWFAMGSRRLGRSALKRINAARDGERCCFSAISIWEVALAVRGKRLKLDRSVADWRAEVLDQGFRETPLTGVIAARSEDFVGLHADPADRFILATADALDATLVTSDEALLAVGKCIDARA